MHKKAFLSQKIAVLFLLFFSLLVIFLAVSSAQKQETLRQQAQTAVPITSPSLMLTVSPTFNCLGACPTIALSPSIEVSSTTQPPQTLSKTVEPTVSADPTEANQPTISAAPTPPCESNTSVNWWRGRGGNRGGNGQLSSFIQQIITFLLQLILQLLGSGSGLQQPGVTPTPPLDGTPTPSTTDPSPILPPCDPTGTEPTPTVEVPTPTVQATLPVSPSLSPSTNPATRLAFAYYPGWVQNTTQPSALDYTAWTHIMHFGMHPTTTGEVAIADMQSAAHPTAAVQAAHAAGKKILLVIGSEGVGAQFVGATSPANVSKFVQNIVNTMKQYGYDGVDIDWEEQMTEAQYVELMKQLRTELDKITPRPLLTTAVVSGLVAPATASKVQEYTDYFNVMSYWSDGVDQFTAYNNAGIPASKIILGLGFAPEYRDLTAAQVEQKVAYVKQQGMPGLMMWSVGFLNTAKTDPRLVPLRDFVAGK